MSREVIALLMQLVVKCQRGDSIVDASCSEVRERW